MRKVLLVEPDFPIPAKSKNHKNFLPIGLLKIASYLRENGAEVRLVRGLLRDLEQAAEIRRFDPGEIWVTSLFTYWAEYVRDAVQGYKNMFPRAKVVVGGIYASLLPAQEVKDYTGCDEVYQGVMPQAEACHPAYDLVDGVNPRPIDYQVIHASRGCKRKCPFCGTWKIEPEFIPENSIRNKVTHRRLVFYDNNLLMNPYIESILRELIELKGEGKVLWCESQSGFDGRLLLQEPHLASMIKKAGFRHPRIAWDWTYEEYGQTKEQIDLLTSAGFDKRDMYVFMLYNWDLSFEEMEEKRIKCWEWQVQIADCRYRPLNQLRDRYVPGKMAQTSRDYYIHEQEGWTDALVKQFRKNVREQNICVRHGFPFYSKDFENKRADRDLVREVKRLRNVDDKIHLLEGVGATYWLPGRIRYPSRSSVGGDA